ncbi:MAG TPA: hypothetical protein VHF88_09180 [Thermoleophilaceae bacterium]|nr:hypothetical protein [Thermoleophilaceae bacterium]
MTTDDLKQLVRDVELPRQKVYRAGDVQYVPAWRLVAVASRSYGLGEDAEKQVDALVVELGGKRIDVVDPWRVIPDLIKRLLGRPIPPREDLYELPTTMLET